MSDSHGLGWVRQLPDPRDYGFSASPSIVADLPVKTTNRLTMPPPLYDQLQIGSCTGNGIAKAVAWDAQITGITDVALPSRLFIYYNERAMEGTIASDSGAQIRDGIKSVAQLGVCNEALWPYDPGQMYAKPPDEAYQAASLHRAIEYRAVPQDRTQLRACLADGYPFVFGFTVFESFEGPDVAETGIMPMPRSNEGVAGGHCVLGCDYDDDLRVVWCANSWGPGWGASGFFAMPYEFILDPNLASDFWTIRTLS